MSRSSHVPEVPAVQATLNAYNSTKEESIARMEHELDQIRARLNCACGDVNAFSVASMFLHHLEKHWVRK